MQQKLAMVLAIAFCTAGTAQEVVRIEKAEFLDKCNGAWAGQMIGVCFGAPYEFKSNGKTIDEPLQPWMPERIQRALRQDDVYVEMTFLETLEKHGPEVTYAQAGEAFGASQYRLWHANLAGRDNIRAGIMPPMSGHPLYNPCADDIDFQIEADLFGILCPGLPQTSNALCEVFGRVMNYGDGLYGGMFVAGMYAAAYFEHEDVGAVVQAGLACIPEASQYHACISDVVRWHAEHPEDWRAAWRKIEDKWQDDEDCRPGEAFNIDAKLNGAYIVMGLLYGAGDVARTLDVATRCGQDADCNPSNALGVLGCMKGFDALGAEWTSGIAGMADGKFEYTNYSFNTLIPASQRMTEALIVHAGGKVEGDAYSIPAQVAQPPATLEQWVRQAKP
jgi:hypothetical protein